MSSGGGGDGRRCAQPAAIIMDAHEINIGRILQVPFAVSFVFTSPVLGIRSCARISSTRPKIETPVGTAPR